MKIAFYVLTKYAKQTYSKECYNIRINAGAQVCIDILNRAGYQVSYCSSADAYEQDLVLFSATSDCDWWEFVAERVTWPKGNYKVAVGGQGVLNVRPFLNYADYFLLGRAEGVIDKFVRGIDECGDYESENVINARTFSVKKDYYIKQVSEIYPNDIELENGKIYHEDLIGCNHKCLFCGYTWQRKHVSKGAFEYSGLWNGGKDRERAMIDMDNGIEVDLVKLRTTAIDGLSQRLRFSVNKKISNEMLEEFLIKLGSCEKPHQVKFYNIIGYPTEGEEDWEEFADIINKADAKFCKQNKQTSILLHSTPFRAMPATPLACEPMSYQNYRGAIAKTLGRGLKGNIFYQGNAMWAVESMATESLPTVIQSAIVWRGTEEDTDNIERLARSRKFKTADMKTKIETLEKYFNVSELFGRYTPEELPTRNIKTYAKVEKLWGKVGWKQ